jgi:hypothetical protein
LATAPKQNRTPLQGYSCKAFSDQTPFPALDHDLEYIDLLAGDPRSTEPQTKNPMGKIPMRVDCDRQSMHVAHRVLGRCLSPLTRAAPAMPIAHL